MTPEEPHRRNSDRFVVAFRSADAATTAALGRMWDWIDKRQLLERFVALAILYGTVKVTGWAMHFAENGNRPGLEVAAIIAAVGAPYMAMQAAAIAFMFRARMG